MDLGVPNFDPSQAFSPGGTQLDHEETNFTSNEENKGPDHSQIGSISMTHGSPSQIVPVAARIEPTTVAQSQISQGVPNFLMSQMSSKMDIDNNSNTDSDSNDGDDNEECAEVQHDDGEGNDWENMLDDSPPNSPDLKLSSKKVGDF